jgi:diguanylate cyclase (GGDEF)-like protein/PAS domain S-box-containing protein
VPPHATAGLIDAMFDESPHGMVLVDGRGIVRTANTAMAELLGLRRGELQGLDLDKFTADGAAGVQEHLRHVEHAAAGRAETHWTAKHAQGNPVHLALSSSVLQDSGGQPESEALILMTAIDVGDRLRQEQRMSYMADHDALTGLMNRDRFIRELQGHLVRYARPQGALLLLDLDRFKEVNDSLGHRTGDQLIISVAALVREGLGQADLVARLGGDEFAVLLPAADPLSAEVVAQGILDRVRAHASTLDGAHRRITASIGVVLVTDRHKSSDELLSEADMTMYDAKEAGRDQFAIVDFTRHSQPRTRTRLQWTDRLQRAIAEDELALHLQPIHEVSTGRVTGAEALLRLVDGNRLITPNHFLGVAERSDLIVSVDKWVLGRSLQLLHQIQQSWPDFRLEVNLSGRSIGEPSVEETLRDGIARHRVDPTGLVLEVTETAAVADIGAARAFAQRQRALGCKFALDDFGAGFGSFYYLKHLLFDYVKIDGEFVAQCHRNATDRTILRSIVGIAHGLGKQTIAEHVAAPEILDAVRAEGVDFAQGYHVGKPVPIEEFLSQLVA